MLRLGVRLTAVGKKVCRGSFEGKSLLGTDWVARLGIVMQKEIATALSMLAVVTIGVASAQDQARLPAGRYLYLGSDPNTSAPKAFNVTSAGAVIWQDDVPASTKSSTANTDVIWQGDSRVDAASGAKSVDNNPSARANAQRSRVERPVQTPKVDSAAAQATSPMKPGMEHIESLEWPIIKFHPKPMPGSKDGFAQLTTTEEVSASGSSIGVVKYKLILLRAVPTELTVELLDANGFRLARPFMVSAADFQTIEGTDLLAARGEFSFSLSDYPKVRDFSLTPRTAQNMFSRQSQIVPYPQPFER